MNSIDELFELAESQHRSGKLDLAWEKYQAILSSSPDHLPTLKGSAVLLTQCGHPEEAIHYILHALKLEPKNPELYHYQSTILLNLKDYKAAEESCQQAVQLNPDYAIAHNTLGNIVYYQEKYKDARRHYETAINLKPDFMDATYNLARLDLIENNNETAIFRLKKLVEMNPAHPKASAQLAKIHYNLKNYSESIEAFRLHLKHHPSDSNALHDLALSQIAIRKFKTAIESLEACLELNPKHPEAHYHLATAYVENEELEKALAHYLQQLSIETNLDTYYNIGVVFTALDRNEDAIHYFMKVIELDQDHFNAHLNLGVIYLKFGHYKEAIHHYEEAARIRPEDPEIQYILQGISQSAETPDAAPKEYIAHLFDQYALYYDKHLQTHLKYQVPQQLYEALSRNIELPLSTWKILDLGCGTGLSGVLLKKHASELIGVDLSSKMLDLAEQKNLYDQLIEADIREYLDQHKDFDLILASDVFSYHGALDVLFKSAYSALKQSGLFIFSVEKGIEYPYQLLKSLRYTHHKRYLEDLIGDSQFSLLELSNSVLRTQQGEAVEGYLVILQK